PFLAIGCRRDRILRALERIWMAAPPLLARIRQDFPQPTVHDVPRTVRELISKSRIKERVKSGGSIAVGVGSRGIGSIATVTKATISTLTEMGYRPFIVAAMGSHGGATAE